jgi:sorting nexin-4
MAYYHSIKGVLKLRDQKQLDFEELSDYLQASIEERDKTRHSQRIDTSMTGYITGKINEVRGADADKIKREKVLKLDERVREVNDISIYLSNLFIQYTISFKRQ